MKRKVAALLLLFLAVLVFYGGAGVNMVSYCCNHCRMAGVEAVLENQCCEIHDHNHVMQETGHGCRADMGEQTSRCAIERMNFDWTNVQSFISNLQPVVVDLHPSRLLNISLLPVPQAKELFCITSVGPPVASPRTYLSLLTTLLI